jgi:hypothetical protein
VEVSLVAAGSCGVAGAGWRVRTGQQASGRYEAWTARKVTRSHSYVSHSVVVTRGARLGFNVGEGPVSPTVICEKIILKFVNNLTYISLISVIHRNNF